MAPIVEVTTIKNAIRDLHTVVSEWTKFVDRSVVRSEVVACCSASAL